MVLKIKGIYVCWGFWLGCRYFDNVIGLGNELMKVVYLRSGGNGSIEARKI